MNPIRRRRPDSRHRAGGHAQDQPVPPDRTVPGRPDQGAERMLGALLGLAAGDALGATLEFKTRADVDRMARQHGRHRDIIGGGVFGWRPGQGTDDTDLAVALARTYAAGYSVVAAADAFLAWYESRPRDIGAATARGLRAYQAHRDPSRAGAGRGAAGNGSLMRALATGLARTDPAGLTAEASEVSAITHDDQRCVDACVAYVHIVSALIAGQPATTALADAAATPVGADTLAVLRTAPHLSLDQLRPTGYVLDTLTIGVWALTQPDSLESLLVDIVNLGGDADTTGAVAGGLLGARDGTPAIPQRWVDRLEYRNEITALAPTLHELRTATAEATR